MCSVFEDKYKNCKSLIVTFVDVVLGKRLFDEPELIVIKVSEEFVRIVQVFGTPPTRQDAEGLKEGAAMRFSHVYICKEAPFAVGIDEGVTKKEIVL